jgi:hypothetical protein
MMFVHNPQDHENHDPKECGYCLVHQLEGDDDVDDEEDGYGEGHASHWVSVRYLPSKVEEGASFNCPVRRGDEELNPIKT